MFFGIVWWYRIVYCYIYRSLWFAIFFQPCTQVLFSFELRSIYNQVQWNVLNWCCPIPIWLFFVDPRFVADATAKMKAATYVYWPKSPWSCNLMAYTCISSSVSFANSFVYPLPIHPLLPQVQCCMCLGDEDEASWPQKTENGCDDLIGNLLVI